MTKTVVLFNGPPRSGKDTCAKMLAERFDAQHLKFANALKNAVHAALELGDIPVDYFEDWKDQLSLNGRTPREVYIAFSEDFIKPLFGRDYFGKRLADAIAASPHEKFVISDGGFEEEVEAIRQVADLKIVRIERPFTSFDKDSRNFLKNPDYFLNNEFGLRELTDDVEYIGDLFFGDESSAS